MKLGRPKGSGQPIKKVKLTANILPETRKVLDSISSSPGAAIDQLAKDHIESQSLR